MRRDGDLWSLLLVGALSCTHGDGYQVSYSEGLEGARRDGGNRGALESCVENWAGPFGAKRERALALAAQATRSGGEAVLLEVGFTFNHGYGFALIANGCYVRDAGPDAPCKPLPPGVEAAVNQLATGGFRSNERALADLRDGECVFVAGLGPGGGARFGVFAPMEEAAGNSPEVQLVRQLYTVFAPADDPEGGP